MNQAEGLHARPFSNIYVEEVVKDASETLRILEKFPRAHVIYIGHYKDVFNRKHQNFTAQKQAPALILAKKEGTLVYKGAPVCQSFGHEHFYYTSCVMNCLFDCEYCYLQGMYPSGNVVLFVNLEETFAQVDALLEQHPVYLCVSYDTDLMALETVTGFVRRWYDFAAARPSLTIEVRTKSGNFALFEHLKPLGNMVFAWTLSPDVIVQRYEHHTASLDARIRNIRQASKLGFKVRVCIDPIIYVPDFWRLYKELVQQVFEEPVTIMDASVGVFRVSNDYMKRMRRLRPECALVHFPFVTENGVYHYGRELSRKMVAFVKDCLREYISEDKIFIWDGDEI